MTQHTLRPTNLMLNIGPTRRDPRTLPTSLEYRPRVTSDGTPRPWSLEPGYPYHWPATQRDLLSSWIREGKGCECCGKKQGEEYINAQDGTLQYTRLQVAHLYHNPERIKRDELMVVCGGCHSAHDSVQKSCGAQLTLACEGRAVWSRWHYRLECLREAVDKDGLPAAAPSGSDMQVAQCLSELGGVASLEEITAAFIAALGLDGEHPADVDDVVYSSLKRLHMRVLPSGLPLVRLTSRGFTLGLKHLTMPAPISKCPPGNFDHLSSANRQAYLRKIGYRAAPGMGRKITQEGAQA